MWDGAVSHITACWSRSHQNHSQTTEFQNFSGGGPPDPPRCWLCTSCQIQLWPPPLTFLDPPLVLNAFGPLICPATTCQVCIKRTSRWWSTICANDGDGGLTSDSGSGDGGRTGGNARRRHSWIGHPVCFKWRLSSRPCQSQEAYRKKASCQSHTQEWRSVLAAKQQKGAVHWTALFCHVHCERATTLFISMLLHFIFRYYFHA